MEIKNKKILITGSSGFLGKHVLRILKKEYEIKDNDLFLPVRPEYDLRKEEDIFRIFQKFKPDIVIHLATISGGLSYYQSHQAEVFYDILNMGTKLLDASQKNNVQKFVAIGTTLSYPKTATIPYEEKDLWSGYPEKIEAPYGIASRILQSQMEFYKEQYNFNSIFLILPSLYGPEDHFLSKDAHVIPSLIKRFFEAKDEIIIWGSGESKKEFLYVEDAARAILLAIEKYDSPEPLNIGPGIEISIKELAEKLKDFTEFKGKIIWDKTKPDGRLKRTINTSKFTNLFNLKNFTNIDEGLKKTISSYKEIVKGKI